MENAQSSRILITGATGNVGSEVVKYLSGKGIPFRAMVRSLDKAAKLPGAEYVTGDFNDPNSLEKALTGIDKAFLLTNSSELAEEQQLRFVDAAVESGVKHIVKLSQWAANVNSPVRFLRYHAVVEQAIENSGIAFTFLRPNLFMQGLLGFKDSIIAQGQFFGAIGEAKVSLIDSRDIAAAAGEALIQSGHDNKIYNLTGPEALSHAQLAEKFSTALGRPVRFVDVPPAALRDMLLYVGFPEWQADGLIEDYAHYALGEAADVAQGFYEATGLQPRSFDDFGRDYAGFFSGK
ncbi:SDR family oxidoreductase [Dyadobacter sp. CY343]|uniref:SDR family oxidoreductase n=1 Tax=Dyadobacter sp. CY343 TaxID=2907299 RepID=UPI001F2BAB37|nr:SDR family oxidoreductase [Dyadobacter sp. CY343]MCE7059499.1 SDR family oxidoreductase [Dyadobacter sp. CY343]